jgi:hypothetical protein
MKLRKTIALGLAVLTSSHSHAQWQDLTANVPGTLTTTNVGPMLSAGGELYVLGNVGIFRSLDGGATFTSLNAVSGGASYTLSETGLRFVEKAGNFIYVGTAPTSAAFNVGYTAMHRLTPGQTSWTQASQVFLPDTVFGDTVDDIALDPASGTYFAASGLAGCYVSSDGLTWSEKRNGLPTYVSPGPIGEFSNGNSLVVKNGKTFIALVAQTTDASPSSSPTAPLIPPSPTSFKMDPPTESRTSSPPLAGNSTSSETSPTAADSQVSPSESSAATDSSSLDPSIATSAACFTMESLVSGPMAPLIPPSVPSPTSMEPRISLLTPRVELS